MRHIKNITGTLLSPAAPVYDGIELVSYSCTPLSKETERAKTRAIYRLGLGLLVTVGFISVGVVAGIFTAGVAPLTALAFYGLWCLTMGVARSSGNHLEGFYR